MVIWKSQFIVIDLPFFITFIYILLFINVNHHQSVISSTFEVLKSARNGIVYGGKLRFLHALVINLLYRSGPIVPRLKSVLEATKDHAQVLAAFAIIYKACVMILKQDAFLGDKTLD